MVQKESTDHLLPGGATAANQLDGATVEIKGSSVADEMQEGT
ncbi:hypothetical protein [Trichococcus palustris]|jgi:beta-glucosidase/6-phospho-beta-glucosidase/beta-galactosidase|nr:hypothetical protein [Trichococcus palustris]